MFGIIRSPDQYSECILFLFPFIMRADIGHQYLSINRQRKSKQLDCFNLRLNSRKIKMQHERDRGLIDVRNQVDVQACLFFCIYDLFPLPACTRTK